MTKGSFSSFIIHLSSFFNMTKGSFSSFIFHRSSLFFIFHLSSFIFLSGIALAQSPPAVLDMEGAVQWGIDHNPSLEAGEASIRGAEAGIKSARGNFFPEVSTRYSHTRLSNQSASEYNQDYLNQASSTWSLRLSQPIFSGFAIINTYRRAQIEEELAKVRQDYARLELTFYIQRRFLELINAREDLRAAEGALDRLRIQLKAAEAHSQMGMTPYLTVVRIKAELADGQYQISLARQGIRAASVRLNALLNIPTDQDMEYQQPFSKTSLELPWDASTCRGIALKTRPDIVVAQKNVALAEKDWAITKRQFLPQVSLDMNYYDQETDYNEQAYPDLSRDYWSVGVNVYMSLSSGGRDFYSTRQAREEIARMQSLLKNLENQIATDVTTAYLGFQDAAERITTAHKAIDAAREAYDMADTRFRTAVGTSLELLDTQSQLTQAEVNLNKALTDQRLALANLYFAMGRLHYDLEKM